MSEASSPRMADDARASVYEANEHAQQQPDGQHQVTQPEPELVGDAPVNGATEDAKQHEAQDVEMDDASAAQHVVQEDFGDSKDGESAQDTDVDAENGGEVGNVEATDGAGGDDAETAVNAHDATYVAVDGNDTAVMEIIDDAETDDEENPTDGTDDAGADAEGDADTEDVADASGGAKDADVEASGEANDNAVEIAGDKETAGDTNGADDTESAPGASADTVAVEVEADTTEDHDMQQEDSTTEESTADHKQQDAANAQEQEQDATETEQHQQDEYDPADPSYDENAYDPDAQPMHAHDEYDPADTGSSSYEQHGSDEYDPANPSGLEHDEYRFTKRHDQEEYDPENPSYEREEYDPSDPSYNHAHGDDTQGSPSKRDTNGHSAVKRKSTDSETASEHSTTERDLKRPRGDSHDSTRSFDTKRADDKKGLTDAAWDRLKDFETLGEFRMNQVSRAAFASVGALPEFAQVSIIARFTRVPMKEVRDKNGQLMRIHHEYLKENPHVASLQPVNVFIADCKSDPGLFDFGFAPPLPVHGMSSVPVPYQREESTDSRTRSGSSGSSASMTSPRLNLATTTPTPVPIAGTSHAEPTAKSPTTDEFGRVINKSVASSSPSVSESSVDRPRATDPRRAVQEKADEPQAQAPGRTDGGLLAAGKPIDPRRRHGPGESEFVPRSVNGGEFSLRAQPGDPRHRNMNTSAAPSQHSIARVETNELNERLPGSVKAVLDKMIREGRLKEAINDNVISRLNHLPEHIALRAVENFNNVDLTHIDNLQGFLVGIINRVNEKSITSERSEPAPRASFSMAPPPSAASGYSGHEGGAVLAYPTGAAARHTERQVIYNREQQSPANEYRGPPPSQGGGADAYGQYGAPHASQHGAMESMQRGSHAIPVNMMPPIQQQSVQQQQHQQQPGLLATGPSRQHMISMLPLSVQQHLQTMAATGVISSIDEFGDKCYEVLAQLSEGLANEVLNRFTNANLTTVRNRSGFLIGVVKRVRQEFGFNN